MFTGIVEAVGIVAARTAAGDGAILRIDADTLPLAEVRVGDSIAVAGVCLTVTAKDAGGFTADASAATLAVTTLGALPVGAPVNLERAVRIGATLGGHLVTGHVDGTAEITAYEAAGDSRTLRARVPEPLARFVARKGSVCIDGVSLTVNDVSGPEFTTNLVPHTLVRTTLGALTAGAHVNLEVDIIARYLDRLHESR